LVLTDQGALATASYMGSAAAKAPSTPRLADFCSALWPVFAPPLTVPWHEVFDAAGFVVLQAL